MPSQLSRWPELPVDFVIAQHSLVDEKLVHEVHRAGVKIFVWTVNDQRIHVALRWLASGRNHFRRHRTAGAHSGLNDAVIATRRKSLSPPRLPAGALTCAGFPQERGSLDFERFQFRGGLLVIPPHELRRCGPPPRGCSWTTSSRPAPLVRVAAGRHPASRRTQPAKASTASATICSVCEQSGARSSAPCLGQPRYLQARVCRAIPQCHAPQFR